MNPPLARSAPAAGGAALTLRDEQKQVTRRRILEAAKTAFNAEGFAAVSVEAIAVGAGVSRQTFYQYFRNKSDVLESLVREPSGIARDALHALATLDEPTFADLERFVELLVDTYSDNRETFRVLSQAEVAEPAIRAFLIPVRSTFVETLSAAIRRHRRRTGAPARKQDIEVEAMLLVAQIERFCNLWLVLGWDADRATVLRVLARTWYAAFQGTPEA